jgi:hypothetical protein
MKKVKAISIFIFLFGGFCVVLCLLMLSSLQRTLDTWKMLQLAGSEGAQAISLENLRQGIITHSIWYAVIGVLSLVSGVGLFLFMEWARKLWLASLVLLSFVTLYWFAIDCYQGRFLEPDNLIGYPISFMLIGGMWFYLTRRKTKILFERKRWAEDTGLV